MKNSSNIWKHSLITVFRYYAVVMAIGTIVFDILLICNITPKWLNLIIGCSLFSCVLNYIVVRTFGFCYLQRHLIWTTAYNVLYNSIIMPIEWEWNNRLELVFVILLSIILLSLMIMYISNRNHNSKTYTLQGQEVK